MPDRHRSARSRASPAPSREPTHAIKHHRWISAPTRLPTWQRWSIYGSTALLTATGLAWLALYAMAPDLQDVLPGVSVFPWQASKQWSMRLHAIGALISCVAVGSLLPLHVSGAWRRGFNRNSGAGGLFTFALLTLTGYALWYAPEGSIRQWSAWMHWGFGCVVPFGLWLHIQLGRKQREL